MSRLELFRLDQTIQTPYRHLKTSTRHPSDTYHKLNRYQTINHVGPFLLIKTRWGFLFLACSSSSCQVLIRPTKVGLGLQVCSGVWHQIKLIIASDMLWLGWDFDRGIFCYFILLVLSRDRGKFRISLIYPDINHPKTVFKTFFCQNNFFFDNFPKSKKSTKALVPS